MLSIKERKIPYLACALIMLAGLMRLLPHPWNFTPIGGLAIYCGYHLSARYAYLLPFLAVLISDYFIGFYDLLIMLVVYLALIMNVFIAQWMSGYSLKLKVYLGCASLITSINFFVLSNMPMWWLYYDHSLAGLVQCYVMALPFFGGFFLSTLCYSCAFYLLHQLIHQWLDKPVNQYQISH